jgi:glycosyltransferase involved in cell wall biosynthesis
VKRLLLVSYYFPPLGGSGVFRALRLSKYLPRHDWAVTVLAASARVRTLKDPSLMGEVRSDVGVERTASFEPRLLYIALNRLGLGRLVQRLEPWLMIPDDHRGWVPFATRRGARILGEREYDAIVTTAGPYSAHLVGLRLRRRTGIPWVADFRDEWTTNPYLRDRYPTQWHRRLNRALEREVLHGADRVVSVSRPWLDAIRGVAPELDAAKFAVLSNGYDAEHFPTDPGPPPDRFRVVYTGVFYGHRSPHSFFEGVRRAVAPGRIPPDDLEIVFMGHGGAAHDGDPVLGGLLRAFEHRPYFESLEQLRRAALLLLVVPPEGGAGNHTGKLFPYLASGRPILALAPEDNVAAELVRSSRSGVVVAPDDPDAIARALVECHAAWRRGAGLGDQDRELIARYEADRQARDWAELLEGLETTESRMSTNRPETVPSE